MERASSAARSEASSWVRPLTTTTQDLVVVAGTGSGGGASKIEAKRGLPPPALACLASALTRARGTNACTSARKETAPVVRTASISRGWSTMATSGPLANTTCPVHHPKSSSTRWAPRGPSCSGPGMESRVRPPPPPARPSWRARSTAATTIRVLAMGDRALTVTPGGAGGRAARSVRPRRASHSCTRRHRRLATPSRR